MINLTDKVAIVTGAAGGIGLDIAQAFIDLDAKVAMVDAREPKVKNAFEASDTKHEPLAITADLTQADDIDKVITLTEEKWGKIDILVNCLGTNVRKKIEEYSEEDWDKVLDVNLKSVFFMSQKVAEIMKVHSYGKIVNISSMMGTLAWGGTGRFSLAPYSASKAGLISLTRSFALPLASYNITVNAICPAFVDTPLVAPLKNDTEIYEDIISRTPMGRFAKTSEISAPALFLASDMSSFITGHALLVDGGWTTQ